MRRGRARLSPAPNSHDRVGSFRCFRVIGSVILRYGLSSDDAVDKSIKLLSTHKGRRRDDRYYQYLHSVIFYEGDFVEKDRKREGRKRIINFNRNTFEL